MTDESLAVRLILVITLTFFSCACHHGSLKFVRNSPRFTNVSCDAKGYCRVHDVLTNCDRLTIPNGDMSGCLIN